MAKINESLTVAVSADTERFEASMASARKSVRKLNKELARTIRLIERINCTTLRI